MGGLIAYNHVPANRAPLHAVVTASLTGAWCPALASQSLIPAGLLSRAR